MNWAVLPILSGNIHRHPVVRIVTADIICSVIYHHDDKLVVDSPMDEVLKDADVIHHCMNDLSKPIKEKEQARFDKLCAEFGM